MFLKSNKSGIIWSLTVIVICVIPGSNLSADSIFDSLGIDKILHGLMHLVLVYLVSNGLLKQVLFSLTKGKALLISFLYSFFLGLFIELLQTAFIFGRTGDVYDVLANTIGAVIGVFIYNRLQKQID